MFDLSWGGHQNGMLPLDNLVQFQPDKFLHPAAALQLGRLAAEFQRVWGARLYADWYQDLYRDYARQADMWERRGQSWLYPSAVASPGHSIHGWARSADLTGYGASGSARHAWLVANAPRFGWSWDYGRALGEGWHFDYIGPLTGVAGLDDITPIEEEKDMARGAEFIKVKDSGNWYVIPDLGEPTFIPAGPVGSENHAHAAAYSVNGTQARVVAGTQARQMLNDLKARNAAFVAMVGTPQGHLDQIEQKIDALIGQEPADVDEVALAALLSETLAADITAAFRADQEAAVRVLQETLPAAVIAELAEVVSRQPDEG